MSAAEIAMILQLLSQGQSDTAIQSILDSNGIKSGALDNIKNLNKIT